MKKVSAIIVGSLMLFPVLSQAAETQKPNQ
ncbi:Uncharacterised protein [Kluyvera cryocrescens]|uniref:Uncharacterized protein n=1 Tax=Kluyvera cryocrescens TaxID=580 RepID=A0A485CXH4_KLUCR|nr:Uncharacterised protein [Kluyvera cryocrescens]